MNQSETVFVEALWVISLGEKNIEIPDWKEFFLTL